MSDEEARAGFRARGEEALGDLAQALLDNPIFSQGLSKAFGAGGRAIHAQRSALGALNLATSSDIERLGQRLRSLSDRLEDIEDRLDDLGDDVAAIRATARERAPDQQERLPVPEGGES